MRFRISLLAQACALAFSATLLQGCDSSEKFSASPVIGQSSGDSEFVGMVAPSDGGSTDAGDNNSNGDGDSEGGGDENGGGTGDGGGNGDGDGTGDGGGNGGDGDDMGDGDGNGGDGDGTGDGDGNGGDGDGTGDGDGNGGDGEGAGDGGGNGNGGEDNGGGSLGPSSSELAVSALNYTASHANLARFAHALMLGTYNSGISYSCAGGGTATLNSSTANNNLAIPTWSFNNCTLASSAGLNVTYSGQLSGSCEAASRTGIENALYCAAVFTQFQSSYDDQTTVFNGSYDMVTESESLNSVASNFSTGSADDTWVSPSQTLATEASELRGLNSRIDTNELTLTIQGQDGYRQASSGCLSSGIVQIKDANSSAAVSIAAAVGGNMIVDDGLSSSTVACSELSPMPYTSPQFN